MEQKLELIKDKITDAIENGNVKMKPRWQFILHGLLVTLGLSFLFLLSTFLLSFFMFKNRMFPPHEISDVIMSMQLTPWLMFGILVLMAAIVFFLNSEYKFAYRTPAVYAGIGLVLVVIMVAFLIDRLTMHDIIRDRFRKNIPPSFIFIRDMYDFDRE